MICVLKMKLLYSDVSYCHANAVKKKSKIGLLRHFLTHLRYTHFPKEQRRECLFAAAPDHRRTNAKSPSSS